MRASFLSVQFLLHIPCWIHFYLGSFSYTSHAGFTFLWGVSLIHPKLAFLFVVVVLFLSICRVSLTHPVLVSVCFCVVFFFVVFFLGGGGGGGTLKHPVLALFLCGEFLLHIPC